MESSATPPPRIQRRIFIVGCSRSGTTILQRCLARHSKLTSFPETDFFRQAIGGRKGRLLASVGLAAPRASRALDKACAALDVRRGGAAAPGRSLASLVDSFVAVLDGIALDRGRTAWIEKTPKHFLYVDAITRYVPDCAFVHVLRDGRDVVASIYDRARLYPDTFPLQRTVDYGIALWNRAMKVSRDCVGRPGHAFAFHADFVADPEGLLRRLCEELGLKFEPAMLDAGGDEGGGFIKQNEDWKEGARDPVRPMGSKFAESFDDFMRRHITRRLRTDLYEEMMRVVPRPGSVRMASR